MIHRPLTGYQVYNRPKDAPLHHDWLPADDEANLTRCKYYLPKPDEIYRLAAQLREQREQLEPPGLSNCPVFVPVRRRSFE
jgi:hypothetical protein